MIKKKIQRIKCLFGKHDISPFVFIYEKGKMYDVCSCCNKIFPSNKPKPKGPWYPIR